MTIDTIKNVYFICDFAADYSGNFMASLIMFEKYLKKQSIKCCYLFPSAAKNKQWANDLEKESVVEYCDFSNKELSKKLCVYLENNSIIYTHFVDANQVLEIKRAAKKYSNIKFIFHLRSRYGNDSEIKKMLKRFIYRNIYFIGVSNAVYDDLCSVFDKNNCFCVPNAIYTDRLNNITAKKSSEKQALILGSHFERKGVDLAIKALAKVNESTKIKLVVVSHFIDEAKQLITKEFGAVPDFIEIIPPVNDIQNLYASSDVFLTPSREEAFGNAGAEAVYCGCRVVASDVPGQNTLKDIPGIIWVESENSDEMADAVIQALSEKRTDTEIQKASKYVEDNYSLSAWCEKVFSVFKQICG